MLELCLKLFWTYSEAVPGAIPEPGAVCVPGAVLDLFLFLELFQSCSWRCAWNCSGPILEQCLELFVLLELCPELRLCLQLFWSCSWSSAWNCSYAWSCSGPVLDLFMSCAWSCSGAVSMPGVGLDPSHPRGFPFPQAGEAVTALPQCPHW